MLISLLLLQSMSPLDVEGIWWTRRGNAQVEIVRTEDGSVRGDIIWTDTAGAIAEEGWVLQSDLPADDRLGKTLLEAYEATESSWSDGKIHDLKNGNSYRSSIRLVDENTLAVEGCRGIFCRTQRWLRVEENEIVRLQFQPDEVSAETD